MWQSSDRDLALSPDGRHLVYRFGGTTTTGSPLMVRAIDQLDARPLAGYRATRTRRSFPPTASGSASSRTRNSRRCRLREDRSITLGPVNGESRRGELGRRQHDRVRHRRPGTPVSGASRPTAASRQVLTKPDAAQRERRTMLFPSVLPDGRGVLFTITATARPTTRRSRFST